MASGFKSRIGFIITLIVTVTQLVVPVSCSSHEDNAVDPNESTIPFSLRDIVTAEALKYDIPQDIEDNFMYYFSGYDDDYRPVWIVEGGKWDIRRIIEAGREKEFDRFILQLLYRMLNSSHIEFPEGETPEQGVILVDMEGFSLKQLMSVPTVTYALKQYQKFLPVAARVHAAYVVNTNYVAETAVNLLRPILGKEFAKVTMFGSNKAKWMPEILKRIPRDQLPEKYGGPRYFTPFQVYG